MRRHMVVLGAVVLAVVSGLLLPSQGKAATQTVHFIVTGAGAGGGPQVRVFHHDGAPTPFSWYAYPQGFGGGVHVAAGDLDQDGIDEVVTGAGAGGGSHVRAFKVDGTDTPIGFFAYPDGFMGGVYVAAGKLKVGNSTVPIIVTGAGPGGGPQVRVFKVDPQSLAVTPFASFFPYPEGFGGGVQVAAADLNGDGTDEIITGAGPGGGPQVSVFSINPTTGAVAVTASSFVYPDGFQGGAFVAGGNLSKEVVTGAGPGGGPQVRTFNSSMQPQAGFFAYPEIFGGGANVAAGDLDTDGREKIVTGAGAGGGPQVRIFNNDGSPTPLGFYAYSEQFGGGVFVAIGQTSSTIPTTTTTTTTNPCAPTTTAAPTTSTSSTTTSSTTTSSTTTTTTATTTTGGATTTTTTAPTTTTSSTTTTTAPTTTTTACPTTTTAAPTTTTTAAGATTTTAAAATTTTAAGAGATTTTMCTGVPPVCLP